MVWIRLLRGKDASDFAKKTIKALLPYKNKLHTITADNGKEFAFHEQIAKSLDISFYFARPYHSWVIGANKNINGLIRQYFPKGSDFSTLTNKEVRLKL